MKKYILLIAFVSIVISGCYSQDVKVNINNKDATMEDNCPYRINGICATEDIGGVNVDIYFDKQEYGNVALFVNYNNFPVSVLWQLTYMHNGSSRNDEVKTGSMVLDVRDKKVVYISNINYEASHWSVTGLIVRKLVQ